MKKRKYIKRKFILLGNDSLIRPAAPRMPRFLACLLSYSDIIIKMELILK